jgi:hypothetical protein
VYVYDTETGRIAFIADGEVGTSDVTPDGRFLVFTSSSDLTSDDTSTAQQVFEYDAENGDLVRVSIGQDGFNDNGNTGTFNAVIPGYRRAANFPVAVAVSNDGAYVAFESSDGLTPGALNGDLVEIPYEFELAEANGEVKKSVAKYYAENVYEYHDGGVYLISDGQDTSMSSNATEAPKSAVRLRGMSPSGDNIFFETADRLVPQDLDTAIDLYDARIDGGFPAPVSLLPSCTSDACQGQLSASPTLLSPGSEFQAGGNPPLTGSEPAPVAKPRSKAKLKGCKKGYVKKKTECVKKSKAKRSAKGRK